ncbi:MAG: cell division protein FtsQ/DivIB [Betaproteobacteria bacterium]|nr:cell division protein FtsQ/DivIB [Betaproteobacteria bacterium]
MRLLNSAANAGFLAALLGVLYLGGHVLVHSPAFALRAIEVHGDLRHVGRAQIVDALQGRVSGTFFTVEIAAIRSLFEGIPWVRRAEVRRVWPDRLAVRLEEHRVFARWGQAAEAKLVNVYGEPFSGQSDADLPLLAGPRGSEREVVRRYAQFHELLAPLALEVRQVHLSARRAWQLGLSNGLTLQLGRDSEGDPVRERLARFVEVYPRTLAPLARRLEYVDLRYPSGFALRVPEIAASEARKPFRRPEA